MQPFLSPVSRVPITFFIPTRGSAPHATAWSAPPPRYGYVARFTGFEFRSPTAHQLPDKHLFINRFSRNYDLISAILLIIPTRCCIAFYHPDLRRGSGFFLGCTRGSARHADACRASPLWVCRLFEDLNSSGFQPDKVHFVEMRGASSKMVLMFLLLTKSLGHVR